MEVNSLSFEQWLVHIGKSTKSAKNYRQAIERSLSQWAEDAQLAEDPIHSIRCSDQFDQLANQVRELDTFQEYNTRGKGMYNAALNHYRDYLIDISGKLVSEDVEQILNDTRLTSTEKSTLVNTRIGQGKFREQLVAYWRGCSVTKYTNLRFLVASHIKPWRDCSNEERIDPFNGLLLLPNLDKAFDLGYISFEETGKIQLSPELECGAVLGVNSDLQIVLHDRHKRYLVHHREAVFRH
jgi:predicted restriction endonuclease